MTKINLTFFNKFMTLTSVKLTSIFMFYIMLIMYMYFYNEPLEAEIINTDTDNQVQEESKFEIKEETVNTTIEPTENGAEAENNNTEISQDIVPIQSVEINPNIEKTPAELFEENRTKVVNITIAVLIGLGICHISIYLFL